MSEPILLGRLPRLARFVTPLRLGQWPTPVERIERAAGLRGLYVKRDDLSSPIYGGSKVRNLEWLLGHARMRGRRALLGAGATGSHLVLALGIHGTASGFAVRGLLYPQPPSDEARRTLERTFATGGRFTESRIYIDLPLQWLRHAIASALLARTGWPAWIPIGGASPVGCLGYVQCALEIAAQVARGEMPAPDYVYCAAGSCGTLVGLAEGFALAGLPCRVVGVRVVPRFATSGWRRGRLRRGLRRLLAREGGAALGESASSLVLHEYAGAGYGFATAAGAGAAEWMRKAAGLALDATYSAKACAGLLDFVARRGLEDRVHLFVQTYDGRAPGDRSGE